MYHSFLIHSSADGHLGSFPVLNYRKQCCDEHWATCYLPCGIEADI